MNFLYAYLSGRFDRPGALDAEAERDIVERLSDDERLILDGVHQVYAEVEACAGSVQYPDEIQKHGVRAIDVARLLDHWTWVRVAPVLEALHERGLLHRTRSSGVPPRTPPRYRPEGS